MTMLGDALAARGRDEANNFTLVRIIAALAVIYGHSPALAAPCAGCRDIVTAAFGYYYSGDLAVHVFFVISGFLVAASFAGRRDVLQFIAARALRIYPALIVFTLILFAGGAVAALASNHSVEAYFSNPEVWRFVGSNATLKEIVFTLPGVFEANHFTGTVNGTLWSLWVEVRVYVLLAVLGAFGGMTNRLFGNLLLLALGIWIALSPSTFPLIGGNELHVRVAAFFGIGMAMFINRDLVPLDWKLAALLCVVAYLCAGRPEYLTVFGGLLAYLTLFVGFLPKVRLPAFVQDYSYGIYLYGWPIQQLIAQTFPDWGPLKLTALAIPASIALGAASWFLVEKPALGWKRALFRPRPVQRNATVEAGSHEAAPPIRTRDRTPA